MFRQYVIRNGYAKIKGIPARAIKTVQGKIWAVYGGFIDKMGIPAGMLFIFYPNQQGFANPRRRSSVEVGIVMGSDSDLEVMRRAAAALAELGLTMRWLLPVPTAIRKRFPAMPGRPEAGIRVIIAGAGRPISQGYRFIDPLAGDRCAGFAHLGGVDSLYSIVQMPGGIPVATVRINGAYNARIAGGRDTLPGK